ncbi:unnamed protein product [Cylicostephanus goldi]|uniref:Uncharacterized protein n=1 Tax=Cylicostephanus goldi TaxID=71465 RepID=A0A3P7Q9U0_CYLGO|nr:unnamed protein product [Cylicostephanus goldi]
MDAIRESISLDSLFTRVEFQFGQALEGHVCGSPQLVSRHQHTANSLLDVISDRQPKTVTSADENSVTFLDLPREVRL